jgi:hypothetical protein
MNLFATQPELPAIEFKPTWTCPITGLVVPKDPAKNLKWRADLLTAAETDTELQVDLYTACSQSALFFINAFVFTLRIFEPNAQGRVQQAEHTHLPFVTWPIQDRHILRIEHGIDEGESLLTDKSRDMGATWDHIAILAHRLIFRADESHLVISRKEDAVDVLDGTPKNYPHGSLADPGTLFGKIDYILSRLPEWMLPRLLRKKLHVVNLDSRTRIDGESANATAGSSDRRTSITLDEFAKVKEAEAIKRSTKDVTACRLVVSTPNGAGTTFSKWRQSGTIDVFVLPWWEHPEKGAGRYAATDELGRWRIRSPWYDQECEARSPKEVAIELDMDHIGSGDTFFEATVIEQHKKLFARKPVRATSVAFKKKLTDEALIDAIRKVDLTKIVYTVPNGPLKIWSRLKDGRLDQTRTYTVGIDISKGQGASNSVMSVMCNETREKVAEWADANTPPYELARLACAMAIWVGGRNKRPLIIWENNGDPGFDFGRQLVHCYHYPSIYFTRAVGTLREKVGKRYGWRSSPEQKAAALGLLRRAYAHGRFINHSEAALNEALTYIQYEGGGIGPAELVEESDAARKAHGDRVIADMLCVVAVSESPKTHYTDRAAGPRTFAHRLNEFKKQKRETGKTPTRFNFVGSGI